MELMASCSIKDDSVEHGPFLETTISTASPEIRHIWWKSKLHKSPLIAWIQSQANLGHALPSYVFCDPF